jgi:hypothetical protein
MTRYVLALLLVVAMPVLVVLFVVLVASDRAADPVEASSAAVDVELLEPQIIELPAPTSSSTVTTVAPTRRVDRQLAGPLERQPDEVWDAVADCESGDWDADGNVIAGTARWDDRRDGYEGGVHWLHSTWIRAGGGRFAVHANDATREEQIEVANDWLARTSWSQWPVCSRKVGAA